MNGDGSFAQLNSAQALHLLSSARYADKLFSDIESVLFASKSKSPFREYKNTLPPGQIKVIEDYLAKFRVQLVKSLEAQGISLPTPGIESVHSIRTTLMFVKIAFEECRPGKMRGYGELPESKVRELNGLVDEMIGAVEKLDSYLRQGLGQDLQGRLERLDKAGADMALLKTLERIINDHGLVEFRPMLSMIIERLESLSFEIALFGRVSSGKSSLLNSIVQSEVLPVGVNPITSVPTRLVFGETARLTVGYADRNPESLAIDRLAEFVTEEHNPANRKHVSRIVVEIPSPHVPKGIVFVDTPGLGSLATSGAAETLAYLPRCDLGVMLIDAASTLTDEDLSTIRLLYEAGVRVSVVLSKSDLLTEADRLRVLRYVSRQIQDHLGIDLSVYAVSARASDESLLQQWLTREIFPLYDRHRQLTEDSLRRKIGALRESVESALHVRLEGAARKPASHMDFAGIEAHLRNAVGRFADARKISSEITHEIESFAPRGLAVAASHLVDSWMRQDTKPADIIIREAMTEIAAAQASLVSGALADLAKELAGTLQDTGRDIGFSDNTPEENLTSLINDMPRLDLGIWSVNINPSFRLKLSVRMEAHRVEKRLRDQIGSSVKNGFYNFGRMLDSWARSTLNELQLHFDTQADKYRAHLQRLGDSRALSESEESSLRRDIDNLLNLQSLTTMEITPTS